MVAIFMEQIFQVSRSRGKIVIAQTAYDLSKKVLINAAYAVGPTRSF